MNIIITESQFNVLKTNNDFVNLELISELDRNWMDSEYEDQYQRIKKGIIKSVKSMMKSFGENESIIRVYGENKNILMSYTKNTGSLWYDDSINDIMEKILPHPIWMVNKKYVMSEVFESYFPDRSVKTCRSAHIV